MSHGHPHGPRADEEGGGAYGGEGRSRDLVVGVVRMCVLVRGVVGSVPAVRVTVRHSA